MKGCTYSQYQVLSGIFIMFKTYDTNNTIISISSINNLKLNMCLHVNSYSIMFVHTEMCFKRYQKIIQVFLSGQVFLNPKHVVSYGISTLLKLFLETGEGVLDPRHDPRPRKSSVLFCVS